MIYLKHYISKEQNVDTGSFSFKQLILHELPSDYYRKDIPYYHYGKNILFLKLPDDDPRYSTPIPWINSSIDKAKIAHDSQGREYVFSSAVDALSKTFSYLAFDMGDIEEDFLIQNLE